MKFHESQIHASHKITKESTIVGERFATTYECQSCGADGYTTVAGDHISPELLEPCQHNDRHAWLTLKVQQTRNRLNQLEEELRNSHENTDHRPT